MQPNKHIVIFSHGFGVRKDDRGLLTDIAKEIPEVESVLFDYFEVDEINKTLTIRTITEQAKMLNDVVRKTRESNPETIIDLIGHSQGTIVSAVAKPDGIRKAILLAPVFDLGLERTMKRYKDTPGCDINLEGESRLYALEGLVRIVPKEYWIDRQKIKTSDEYNAFAEKAELIFIEANQDEFLHKVALKDLSPKAKIMSLEGDHNFTGENREGLIKKIREILFS